MSDVNFIAGIPGAGKTALLIDLLLKEVIPQGRPIYIDQRLNPTTGVFGPSIPDLNIPHHIIDDITRWHEPGMVPDGAVLVVDEAQDIWPQAPSGAKLTPDLLAMNRIRQRGITLYCTSQRPNMMRDHIRGLVGRYILLRKTFYGRKLYEWSEFPDRPLAFKEAPQQRGYTLPKHVFELYRSASLHVKHKRTIPRVAYLLAACVVVLAAGSWYAYKRVSGTIDKAKEDSERVRAPGTVATPAGARAAAAGPARPVGGRVLGVAAPVKDREPYAGLGLHLAGSWDQAGKTRASFTASIDGRTVATVRDVDLQAAGYSWRLVAPCVALLIFGDRERVAACDTPAQSKAAVPAVLAASAPA